MTSRRRARNGVNRAGVAPSPTRRRPHDYYLFVLGSGGHTKEMLMMMDDGFCDFQGIHRRYLLSSGDTMSQNHLEAYEDELRQLCARKGFSPGSYDSFTTTRARKVHQPLWTVPLSAMFSIIGIFPVLMSPPTRSTLDAASPPIPFPRQVFSNGPATGFFVALAAHLLRMFFIVPQDCMKVVYIESWARISTLSLTGRLLYHTGLADVFLVQHEKVAAKYGVANAGNMVFNARRPAV